MLLSAALLLGACSETKYVPDGMYLLDGVKVRVDGDNYVGINPGQLKDYVRQRGNARWFSSVKLPLHVYSLSGRDTTTWINRLLRNIGEPPVLLDTTLANLSCRDIRQSLKNSGYLDAEVECYLLLTARKLRPITCYRQAWPISSVR